MGEKVLSLPRKRRVDVLRFAAVGPVAPGRLSPRPRRGRPLRARARDLDVRRRLDPSRGRAGRRVAAEVRRELSRYDGTESRLRSTPPRSRSTSTACRRCAAASSTARFPHTLRVRVVPELPVAVLRRGADSFLVSARGRVIAPASRSAQDTVAAAHLAAGRAPTSSSAPCSAVGTGASRPARSPRSSAAASPNRVTFVRALDGQITLGLRGGLEIHLGPPVDLRVKIAIARSIVPGLALPSTGGPTTSTSPCPERPVAGRNPQPAG